MKKVILLIALSVCFTLLASISAWASPVLFHDAIYHWRDGGTWVTQTFPETINWNIGNPTGSDWIEVWEKDFTLDSGRGEFSWWLTNDRFQPIYSFHVPSIGYNPVDSYVTPTGWSFSSDGYSYNWWTTTDPIDYSNASTKTKHFSVTVYCSNYDISTGAVDVYGAQVPPEGDYTGWYDGDGYWVLSHPAPEPASAALLGLGLFGLIGTVRRRRFKA